MYREHFGLNEAPFRITPHTAFFFSGANRGPTLDALVYAITHDEGIVKVSGEVGSGKTMLCRVLMERLPAHVATIYLANPSLSREDILFAIADELGLHPPENARVSLVLRTLQEHLVGLYGQGRQVVVLIDEAHAMPAETLEQIRLLSNLESNRHKLLQLVLFGQPELDQTLGRDVMRSLRERITHNFALDALARDDVARYLEFRMRAAGYRGPSVFGAAAVRLIANVSKGLTRRINILADKALLAAFADGSHAIGTRQVKAAIRDSQFSDRPRRQRTWALAAIGLGLAGIAGWVALHPGKPPSIAPATAPVEEIKVPDAGPPAVEPATATSAVEGVLASPPAPEDQAPPALPAPDGDPAPIPQAGTLTRQRFAATGDWLDRVPDHHWFIQLLSADAQGAGQTETFLAKAIATVGADHLHVYVARVNGGRRIGVIYGDYPTRKTAGEALKQLPEPLRDYKPFVRQVTYLRQADR